MIPQYTACDDGNFTLQYPLMDTGLMVLFCSILTGDGDWPSGIHLNETILISDHIGYKVKIWPAWLQTT